MQNDRSYWIELMIKIADPVLSSLEKREFKSTFPLGKNVNGDRQHFTHLEALARLLSGMAPWLEAKGRDLEEEKIRSHYCLLAREAIDAGTDPDSPDFMNFSDDFQPIVDTAFLALAILRAPRELWSELDDRVKENVIRALKETRTRKPPFNNWLLFSAITEAALKMMGDKSWDPMRIDYAIKQVDQWYLGDGVYSDGPEFHYDYYNSYVIHPMLVDLMDTVGDEYRDWAGKKEEILRRSTRHAEIQERLISPEGTFPPVGRSLVYRTGAFQTLAQHALLEQLPHSVSASQVRCALSALLKKSFEARNTFTAAGWLTIGLAGKQEGLAEAYISTGSLYLCAGIFLPLGLPRDHAFWSDPDEEWTAKKVWSGKDIPIDTAQ